MIVHADAGTGEGQKFAECCTDSRVDFANGGQKQGRDNQAQAKNHDDIGGNELEVFLFHRSKMLGNQSPPRGGMGLHPEDTIPQALRIGNRLFLDSITDRRIRTLAEEAPIGAAVAVAGKLVLLFAGILSDEELVVAYQGLRRHVEFRVAACVKVCEAADGQVSSRAQAAVDVLEDIGWHYVEHLAAVALDELDAAEFPLDFRDAFAIYRLENGDEDKHVIEVEIFVACHHSVGQFANGSVGGEVERA